MKIIINFNKAYEFVSLFKKEKFRNNVFKLKINKILNKSLYNVKDGDSWFYRFYL